MKILLLILGYAAALLLPALILLAAMAFQAAGTDMKEIDEWRG